jgi:hypothetical protein
MPDTDARTAAEATIRTTPAEPLIGIIRVAAVEAEMIETIIVHAHSCCR